MPVAPLPEPQYIDYTANVKPFIGTDKVLVADNDSTAVPIATANQLVAEGEALAITDLEPYYITAPALITTSGNDWTTLKANFPTTYAALYYMFVTQAALKLIGTFIAKNTDTDNTSLSYFQKFYEVEYAKYNNRIREKLANGSYRYQIFQGLQPLSGGIPRRPKRYSMQVSLGQYNYTDGQVINPAQNFDIFWGNTFGNTRGGQGW